jgi:hypothetical protein
MDAATREFVWQRADRRCEYCRLPQAIAPFFTFHVEHFNEEPRIEMRSELLRNGEL